MRMIAAATDEDGKRLNDFLRAIDKFMQNSLDKNMEIRPSDYDFLVSNASFREYGRPFFEQFRMDAYGQIQKRIIPANVAEYIVEHFHYVIIAKKFYVYKNGAYFLDGSEQDAATIRMLIRNLIPPDYRTKNLVNEVMAQLITPDKIRTFDTMNTHPAHFICFRNGVYDPVEKKMLPHDPDYRFLNQIPFDYDPEAPLPDGTHIEKFFRDIELSDASRIALLTFSGFCLTTDTSLQLFLVLKGVGGSGKSTLLNLISHVIGEDNLSDRSLDQITENRFAAYGVAGKLCNIFADIKTNIKIDPTTMKQLTGEDRISVEPKGVNAFELRPYAKFAFSMNGYPYVDAKDEAFYRRLIMIPMNKKPEKTDLSLDDKLIAEAAYFLKLSVKALEDFYEHPDKEALITPETVTMSMEWQRKGDSVAAWLADGDRFDGNAVIKRTDAFDSYNQYCVDEGRESLKKENFYDSLRSKGYNVDLKRDGFYYIRNPHYKDEFKNADQETPFT